MPQLIAFLLYPALELYLLVKAGAVIGAFPMVLWVFASALLGIWAIQTQSRNIVNRAAGASRGGVSQEGVIHGLLLFIAGALLILPGLISDAIGLLLLIPLVRKLSMAGFGRHLAGQAERAGQGGGFSRIFFYRSSTGFGGPDSPFSRNSGPRQETVIDSTAVEVASGARDDASGARSRTDNGAGAANTPDVSGTFAAKG